jgi:hypothetical protein
VIAAVEAEDMAFFAPAAGTDLLAMLMRLAE